MNKRNFIISIGAALALIMLATCYAAVNALRSGVTPEITEEYRQTALSHEGNPFRRIGSDFAEIFIIIGNHLIG